MAKLSVSCESCCSWWRPRELPPDAAVLISYRSNFYRITLVQRNFTLIVVSELSLLVWRCAMTMTGSLCCWLPQTVHLHASAERMSTGTCVSLRHFFLKSMIRSLVLLTLTSRMFSAHHYVSFLISTQYESSNVGDCNHMCTAWFTDIWKVYWRCWIQCIEHSKSHIFLERGQSSVPS